MATTMRIVSKHFELEKCIVIVDVALAIVNGHESRKLKSHLNSNCTTIQTCNFFQPE
jgi:uncharacterized membrane protein